MLTLECCLPGSAHGNTPFHADFFVTPAADLSQIPITTPRPTLKRILERADLAHPGALFNG